jgi:hypothetical protein
VRLSWLAAAIVAGLSAGSAAIAAQSRPDSASRAAAGTDSLRAPGDTLPADSVLNVDLFGRLEFKGEQTRNDRCYANQLFSATFRCQANLTPQLDFQFSLNSSGTIANRVRVNVDYDSQREFDGSNLISLAYEGRPGEYLQRLEVGNVSFAPPAFPPATTACRPPRSSGRCA